MSTRKLATTPEEQAVLEDLIDSVKPPPPAGIEGLHFLLTTPFRYPPFRHGSRFATRAEPALWYGSTEIRTVLAEVAYYRFVFLEGSRAQIELKVDLSVFRVQIRTRMGIDLTVSPFAAHESDVSAPDRYDVSQQLGRDMRQAGVQAFRYRSARDPMRGVNVGVFTPRVFAAPMPSGVQTWWCGASRRHVEFVRSDLVSAQALHFERQQFEVGGALPAPAP